MAFNIESHVCRSNTECRRGTLRDVQRIWRLLLLAIALSSLCSGCGTQATIALRNGGSVRGRIIEKQRGFFVAENERQGRFAVHEQHVQHVQHPGTAAMILGGIVAGVGAALTIRALVRDCDPESTGDLGCKGAQELLLLGGAAFGATGVGIGLYGLGVHMGSRERAREVPESSGACVGCGHGVGFAARF
jgi:hypothetical protein